MTEPYSSTDGEIWKPVSGYEGFYEVSDRGGVRSVDRTVMNRGFPTRLKGRLLKPNVNVNGYKYLVFCREGVTQDVRVHKLVAGAFVQNPEGKATVNHLNGIKTDNRSENLAWATSRENNVDALETRLRIPTRGSRHGNAKLTEDDVLAIRARLAKGDVQSRLAEEYRVTFSTINHIKFRLSWRHLPDSEPQTAVALGATTDSPGE